MNNSDASIFSLNSINSLKFIFIYKKGLFKNVGLNEINKPFSFFLKILGRKAWKNLSPKKKPMFINFIFFDFINYQ